MTAFPPEYRREHVIPKNCTSISQLNVSRLVEYVLSFVTDLAVLKARCCAVVFIVNVPIPRR